MQHLCGNLIIEEFLLVVFVRPAGGCTNIPSRLGTLIAMALLAPPTTSSSLIIHIFTTAGQNITTFLHIVIQYNVLICSYCTAFAWPGGAAAWTLNVTLSFVN